MRDGIVARVAENLDMDTDEVHSVLDDFFLELPSRRRKVFLDLTDGGMWHLIAGRGWLAVWFW